MTAANEVDAWFAELDHPLKEVMQRTRELILAADERVEESVKWKTPTFSYNGNIVSIQPRAKRFVSLMFHRGSEIPGEHPDLEGDAALVRTMKFADLADLEARGDALGAVIRAWCGAKSEP